MLLLRFVSFFFVALLLFSILMGFIMVLRARQKAKGRRAMPSDAGLRDLISAGKLDEAVDIYRRFTGVDEFTARKLVDDLAREIRLNDTPYRDVAHTLKVKGKAAAIETYQTATGANLADALAYVEGIEKGRK